MATVLFVHNNFPAQFRALAETLVARGVRCGAIAQQHASGDVPGVPSLKYAIQRGTTFGILPLAVRAEADFLRASYTHAAAQRAQSQGFTPDLIIGHTGWGETALLKEVWPQARQILYPEFFYASRGLDVGFDLEFKPYTEEARLLARSKNAVSSMAMTDADALVCPTPFQAATLPKVFQPLVRLIHEGVELDVIRPGPAEPFVLDDGRVIQPGTPVITHVNNNMEPLRGLHILARALPRLLAEVPQAQAILIGNMGDHGYSGSAPNGKTWKEVCFEGVEIDPARVHFLGRVPHARMLAALRLSTAHVYYSYPFVLSWSLAEAMASGCYVIGSDTAPLRDAIENGINGRLLPFFDVAALSEAMIAACRDPAAQAGLRAAARATAERLFDRRAGLAAWIDLIRELGVAVPDLPAP
ncbi:glycosyltransferase [Phenylobacterium soli]|uniref:Group 1 glycosyl transferase n=1 Tax=Phenylobacterium soli TaxID=2170551 RepID=A0A328AP02_9CAUL|nr:glycosyltransferase [Phenylobacterium soli]RAK55214.1 group 1 glycosyl transferase [Phenylobacterium soli]